MTSKVEPGVGARSGTGGFSAGRLREGPLGERCDRIAPTDVGRGSEFERRYAAEIHPVVLCFPRRSGWTEDVLLANNLPEGVPAVG